MTELTAPSVATNSQRRQHLLSPHREKSSDDEMDPPTAQPDTLMGKLTASGQSNLLAYAHLATKTRPNSSDGRFMTSSVAAKKAPKFKEEHSNNTTNMILGKAAMLFLRNQKL
mgnify:CR=1 FL=1